MDKETYYLYREELHRILSQNDVDELLDDDLNEFTKILHDRWSIDTIRLYRYSPADYYNIRNFETSKLKLTNTGVLNDVYEGIPADVHGTLDQNILHQLEDIAQIKSFSETPNDVRMWGYYANSHTGFCVEYDIHELDYKNPIINHIFPVVYSKKRLIKTDVCQMISELKQLRIDIKDRNEHDYDGYLEDIMPLFLTKGEKWSYEREWRIIYTLLQIYEEDEEQLYNGIIHFDCATGIYLGYRINKEIENNIHEIVERINKDRIENGRTTISIYKMCLENDSYELSTKKIK